MPTTKFNRKGGKVVIRGHCARDVQKTSHNRGKLSNPTLDRLRRKLAEKQALAKPIDSEEEFEYPCDCMDCEEVFEYETGVQVHENLWLCGKCGEGVDDCCINCYKRIKGGDGVCYCFDCRHDIYCECQ